MLFVKKIFIYCCFERHLHCKADNGLSHVFTVPRLCRRVRKRSKTEREREGEGRGKKEGEGRGEREREGRG